ncbi:MAG TPA: type II secretion system protein [Longimicrobiaceae bacterium]|nr:type II secretion system protein [Longimicrobiaceae bacterium]
MNRFGTTLIELVVGLTIVGLVLAAGYGALHSVVEHRQRADETTREVVRASTLRHTLVSWLAGAHLTVEEGGPEFRGLDGIGADASLDEVTFLTTASTPLDGGAPIFVRLFVDRDEATPERGLVAELAEWRGSRTLRLEMEPRAAGLELRYLSGISGGERWMPSWISSSVLPRGVELTLVPPPADSLAPLLRLPIRVHLEGGT